MLIHSGGIFALLHMTIDIVISEHLSIAQHRFPLVIWKMCFTTIRKVRHWLIRSLFICLFIYLFIYFYLYFYLFIQSFIFYLFVFILLLFLYPQVYYARGVIQKNKPPGMIYTPKVVCQFLWQCLWQFTVSANRERNFWYFNHNHSNVRCLTVMTSSSHQVSKLHVIVHYSFLFPTA